MKSWLPISPQSHFSLANIPFGIISTKSKHRHVPAIAIGDYVLDLSEFASQNGFSSLPSVHPHEEVFSSPTLNAFAALGKSIHTAVRIYLQSVFLDATPFPKVLKENRSLRDAALIPSEDAIMHLPMTIGDYTDFYAGMNHAFNVGVLFRGAANALQPNYKHLPVGYHGRASSVVVSGTPIRRPNGQILTQQSADVKVPSFSACQKLDIELELGAFLCRGSNMGDPVSVDDAESYIFGLVLLNDWSARDIQAWEYVPLGPFNSKNFGTTISPWVVLTDALEPYRTQGLENDVDLLPYLREDKVRNMYDIKLEVDLKTHAGKQSTICKTSGRNLLFSFPQMLAHHTVTGCPVNTGDLLGSGTISGKESNERGSLLEQNENGKTSIKLEGGDKRTFLEDGDEVTLRGYCGEDDGLVGFGECTGVVMPAHKVPI